MRVPPATSDLRACHGTSTSLPGNGLNRGYDKVTVHEYYTQRRGRRVESTYMRGGRGAYDGGCAPLHVRWGVQRHLGNLGLNGREAPR